MSKRPADADNLQMRSTCRCKPPADADQLQMRTTCRFEPPADEYHLQMQTTCRCKPPAPTDANHAVCVTDLKSRCGYRVGALRKRPTPS